MSTLLAWKGIAAGFELHLPQSRTLIMLLASIAMDLETAEYWLYLHLLTLKPPERKGEQSQLLYGRQQQSYSNSIMRNHWKPSKDALESGLRPQSLLLLQSGKVHFKCLFEA